MRADLRRAHVGGASRPQSLAYGVWRDIPRPGDKKGKPHSIGRGADRFGSNSLQGMRDVGAPSIKRNRLEYGVTRRPVDQWLRDYEHRHARGMIGPFDEWQPSNNFWRVGRSKLRPPGASPWPPIDGEHTEIADRPSYSANHLAGAEVGHTRSRKSKVESG